MYHIKDDLRSKKSAESIYRSIRHLLFEKPLSEITITDIKNECGVSRSSFYRNFDTILDPLEMKLDFFVYEYLSQLKSQSNHILYFYTYWDMHSDFISILTNEGYTQLIINSFQRNLGETNEYLISVQVSIMSTLLSCWVKNNKKESIEEMTKITLDIINSNALIL